MAIIAALVGFLIAVATVVFGNKIGNRWLRYVSLIVGIVCALGAIGAIASDNENGLLAGEIFAGLIVASCVVKSIFFRKKKTEN